MGDKQCTTNAFYQVGKPDEDELSAHLLGAPHTNLTRQRLTVSPSKEIRFVPFKLETTYYKMRLATERECSKVELSRAYLQRTVSEEGSPRKLVISKKIEVNQPNQGSQISPKSKQAQLLVGGGQGEGFMEDYGMMEKQFSFLNIQIQRLTPRIKPLSHAAIKDSLTKLQWTDEDQEKDARKACDLLHKLCTRFKRDLKVPMVYDKEQTYLNKYTSLQGGIVDLLSHSEKTPTNFICQDDDDEVIDELFGNNDSGSQELAVEEDDEEYSCKSNKIAHALMSENQCKQDLNKCVRQSITPEEGRRPSLTSGDFINQRDNLAKYCSGLGNQRKCTFDDVAIQKNKQIQSVQQFSVAANQIIENESKSQRSFIQLKYCEPIGEVKIELQSEQLKSQGQNQCGQEWQGSDCNISVGDDFSPRIRFVSGQNERRFELGLIQCESVEQAKHYIGMQRKVSSIIDGEQKYSSKKLLNLTSKGLKELMEAHTSTNKYYQQLYQGQNNTATRLSQKEDESFRSVLSQYSSDANLNISQGLSSTNNRMIPPQIDQHNPENIVYVSVNRAKELTKKTEKNHSQANVNNGCNDQGKNKKNESLYSNGVVDSPENVLVIPDSLETQDNSPDSNASSGCTDNNAKQGPFGINQNNYPLNKISHQPRKDSKSSFDFNIFNLQQQLLNNGLQPSSNMIAEPSIAQRTRKDSYKQDSKLVVAVPPNRDTKVNKFKIRVSSLLEEVPQTQKNDLYQSYANEEAQQNYSINSKQGVSASVSTTNQDIEINKKYLAQTPSSASNNLLPQSLSSYQQATNATIERMPTFQKCPSHDMAAQNQLEKSRGQNNSKCLNINGMQLSGNEKSPRSSGKRGNEDSSSNVKGKSNYKDLNRNLKDLARDLNCDDDDPTAQFYTNQGYQQPIMNGSTATSILGQPTLNYNNRQINSPKNMDSLRAALGGPQTQPASQGVYLADSVTQGALPLQQPRRASLITNKSAQSQRVPQGDANNNKSAANSITPNNYNIAASSLIANKQQPFKISLQRAE